MDQDNHELVLGHGGTSSTALEGFPKTRSGPIAPRESNAVLPAPEFGRSHSHRVWRMMNALIDARRDWADQGIFEADREKMLRYGLSIGMTAEELFRITDPDVILGLWAAAEAKDAELDEGADRRLTSELSPASLG